MTDLTALAHRINQLLPQTQCTKCGYEGCQPYAEAIAQGVANYNQCPPGGQEGIRRLASLLHKPIIALNPDNGVERTRARALIDEKLCIGCTLCIQACPVDAIVGAPKQMHTVLEEWCTGCDLCVPPCPVDCITMLPVSGTATGWQAWSQTQADDAKHRHERHLRRISHTQSPIAGTTSTNNVRNQQDAPSSSMVQSKAPEQSANDKKQALIQAVLERARQRK